MHINVKTPRQLLSPLLSQKSIALSEFEAFKTALSRYAQDVAQHVASKQTEPNIVMGALVPFLAATPFSYSCRPVSQKGNSGIDLAIFKGADIAVIIEAKAPGSKDMITPHDLNRKAFHEAIFYFMQARNTGNDTLTHVVITDFHEWFVFDAKDFERLFWRNAQLQKTFNAYHDPNLLTSTTAQVYAAIEAAIPTLLADLVTPETIDCAHFNLAMPDRIRHSELVAIYKLLHQDNLLKAFNPNDANSLNRAFYNELLYILGLEDVKADGKRLIKAANTPGSFYDGITDKLDQQGKPSGFDDVIKLIILWINRILFLKLLESQIVTWTGDANSRFLSTTKIKGYDALENLFFDTLARRISDRKNKGFDTVPYLNSSLFEMQDDEKNGIGISALSDSAAIAYYDKTVVKDAATHRKSGATTTLAYLFEFLDAYDFANDSGEEVRVETKALISASVLGLIFEKINGYKDGSFYTPSFVTMYMARQTIEKAVLQKFNETYGWQCADLIALHNTIEDIAAANQLIDSLKICDPAVGSGHFLVSVLNEILRIKGELGVLVDIDGRRIKGWHLSIENDELIVTSDDGELFEYKKGSKEKTLIQKTLFQEKHKIIENCLFGVDINPNSVNICRLRLWIELLKNAYYQPNGELETLPNIDINIKCGNSLISRFALDTDLKDALNHSKISVDGYRDAVSSYRNVSDKAKKREIERLIADIKGKFTTDLQTNNPNLAKLSRARDKLRTLEGQAGIFEDEDKKVTRKRTVDLKTCIAKLEAVVEELKNGKIYQNALEWRIEFPEVLDSKGRFIGFDVVIGNPPYIFARENFTPQEKSFYVTNYTLSAYQINLYILFLEKCSYLLKPEGILTLIVPNNWLTVNSAKTVREFVLAHSDISIINFTEKVFNEANVDTAIVSYTQSNTRPNVSLYESSGENDFKLVKETDADFFLNKSDAIINIASLKHAGLDTLLDKIEARGLLLKQVADVKAGLKAYELGKGSPLQTLKIKNNRTYHSRTAKDSSYFTYLDGKDVARYKIGWSGEYLKYGNNLAATRTWALFSTPRILVRQIPAQPPYCIHACFTKEVMLNDLNSMNVVNIDEPPLFVLALLNSRLLSFWFVHKFGKLQRGIFPQFKINELEQFPIATTAHKKPFISKVKAILKTKLAGKDAAELEREIDDMVYKLYGLSYKEVKIIEPDYTSMTRAAYEAYALPTE